MLHFSPSAFFKKYIYLGQRLQGCAEGKQTCDTSAVNWKSLLKLMSFSLRQKQQRRHVLDTWQTHFIWHLMRVGNKKKNVYGCGTVCARVSVCVCVQTCTRCFRRWCHEVQGGLLQTHILWLLVTGAVNRPYTILHTHTHTVLPFFSHSHVHTHAHNMLKCHFFPPLWLACKPTRACKQMGK